ncbi:hypothetical protein Hdeb2414_s0009g00306941 [Helianthus debilis subsp. tardiflorus]
MKIPKNGYQYWNRKYTVRYGMVSHWLVFEGKYLSYQTGTETTNCRHRKSNRFRKFGIRTTRFGVWQWNSTLRKNFYNLNVATSRYTVQVTWTFLMLKQQKIVVFSTSLY